MKLRNPLTMQGFIDQCWLFTFATPEQAARKLLPLELEPVVHRGAAFWNVVICHIQAMRPLGAPAAFGLSYWHAAYRLYVRCYPEGQAPVEGLYFLRSDCNNPLIGAAGNLLTDFHFHTARITADMGADQTRLRIDSPDAPARAVLDHTAAAVLPADSVFGSLEEAAAFLKYQPCGISVPELGTVNLVRIRRDESAWRSRLVHVREAEWAFFADHEVRPEICYQVEPIRYVWERGVTLPAGRRREPAPAG